MRMLAQFTGDVGVGDRRHTAGVRISLMGWGSAALVSLLLWEVCLTYLMR